MSNKDQDGSQLIMLKITTTPYIYTLKFKCGSSSVSRQTYLFSLHKPNEQRLKDIKYFRKSSFVNVSMFVILSFNLDSSVVTIVYGYNDTRESKIKLFSIPGSFSRT